MFEASFRKGNDGRIHFSFGGKEVNYTYTNKKMDRFGNVLGYEEYVSQPDNGIRAQVAEVMKKYGAFIVIFSLVLAFYVSLGVVNCIKYSEPLSHTEYDFEWHEHERKQDIDDQGRSSYHDYYYFRLRYTVDDKEYRSRVRVPEGTYDRVLEVLYSNNREMTLEEAIGDIWYCKWNPEKLSYRRLFPVLF